MATKFILKDAKAPFLLLRRPFSSSAAAVVSNTASPNPQLVHSIHPPNLKPLIHLSGMRQYLYYQQQPSPYVDALGPGGAALGSAFGLLPQLQARCDMDYLDDDSEEDDEVTESDEDDESDEVTESSEEDDEDDEVTESSGEDDEDDDDDLLDAAVVHHITEDEEKKTRKTKTRN